MHLTSIEHIECTRGQREVMHASVRRERMERLEAEGGVPKHGRGRDMGKGRVHHDDGEGTS